MEQYKKTLNELQEGSIRVIQCMSRMIMSNSVSAPVINKQIDDYLCELENLCVQSRVQLDKYRLSEEETQNKIKTVNISDVAGEIEVTCEGWLHITLHTLLPSCKYRISGYISDTITRLLNSCRFPIPYFEKAFLAVVEYCNNENHNALDNDNKGWKMIPNSLKGRVIADDSQFILSIGLFTEISEDARCEIYVMPPEDTPIFMENMNQNMF